MSLKKDVNVEQPALSSVSKCGSFSYNRKKKIVRDIERLKSKQDYIALFKIINNVTDKYTQNKNGIFINLNCLPNSTLVEIEKFLQKTNTSVDISQLHSRPQSLKFMQHKSMLSSFANRSSCLGTKKTTSLGGLSLSDSALSISEGVELPSFPSLSPPSPSPSPSSPSVSSMTSMKLTNYEKSIVKSHRDFYSEQSSDSEFYTT